jgi:hypothetical protein
LSTVSTFAGTDGPVRDLDVEQYLVVHFLAPALHMQNVRAWRGRYHYAEGCGFNDRTLVVD